MNKEEIEMAFARRLPVMAKVNGIAAEGCVLSFSCIYAIRRRWDETLGGEVTELELLDRNRRSITTVGMNDVFFDEKECTAEADFDKCRRVYERYFGLLTPKVSESVDFYLRSGLEAELINRIIEYSHEQGKHSWSYISAILMDKLKRNIRTVEAFEQSEAQWREHSEQKKRNATGQRNKFANYNDTNKPDYTGFGEQILKEMLEDAM